MTANLICRICRVRISRARLLVATGILCSATLPAQTFRSERQVSGVVLDAHRQPLRGAVVQLENESTESIMTFLSDGDGHYTFKHVGTNDDYRLSATFHGHRSKSKELSKFSSNLSPIVRLVIRSR